MRINEILRLVLINIRQNKFKVFLTSLGIIVGTATIVMVIAIGEGGTQDVIEQYSTLNAGTITVEISDGSDFMMGMEEGMMSGMESIMGGMDSIMGGITGGSSSFGGSTSSAVGSAPSSGVSSGVGMSVPGISSGASSSSGGMASTMDVSSLTEDNLEEVLFFVPDVSTGAISASTDSYVLGGELEEETEYTIVGTLSTYQEISNLSLLVGDFITDSDQESETRCVILGYNVAVSMFDTLSDAYDSLIEIDGRSYVVNGVLSEMGSVTSGIDPDNSIFMPYSTAEKYVFEDGIETTISILASDISKVDAVIENIEIVLSESLPSATFSITDAGATIDAAMESANTLAMLLVAIAIIVFVVGGIGIMNVLFVSVKERTREIGILKAIGTSKGNILLLFIAEASIIGVFGGILGVGMSFLCMPVLAYLDISAIMTTSSLLLAFGFAVATGTIFGVYPAYSASNLVPIEALESN